MNDAATIELAADVRRRMVDIGGRAAQDLGLSRVVGQILLHLYLQPAEQSLDQIAEDLGLSKASVCIGIRQIEDLGLVKRVWKKGDRRNYYRSADNIASALRQGLLTFLTQKIQSVAREMDAVHEILESAHRDMSRDESVAFLKKRVDRARAVQKQVSGLLGNPVVKLFGRL